MKIHLYNEVVKNKDGTAIKYDDGLMICFGKFNISQAQTAKFGDSNLYRTESINVEMPVNFTEVPSITFNCETYGFGFCVVDSLTYARSKIRVVSTNSANPANIQISFIAIGRWK